MKKEEVGTLARTSSSFYSSSSFRMRAEEES